MADTPPPPSSEAPTIGLPPDSGSAPRAVTSGLVGSRIGNYEILSELGRGGMGVVYKARQSHANRIVALKVILSAAPPDAESRARFAREAEAAAQLTHPHIVQIHEVGTWQTPDGDGIPFFSMEFCSGGSLGDFLDGTPLAPVRAAALLEVLARAVHSAHSHQLVHRDLKPANILLVPDAGEGSAVLLEKDVAEAAPMVDAIAQARQAVARRRGQQTPPGTASRKLRKSQQTQTASGQRWLPKITDFGLARRIDDDSGLTATGAIVGTPSYMAPEQARGHKDIGPGADIYALGAILYECLTGRPPFLAASAFETLIQVGDRDPVPPQDLNPHVPDDISAVCLRCLEKLPHRRYTSAADLADDLARFREGNPTKARPRGLLGRAKLWCLQPARIEDAGRVTLFVAMILACWIALGGLHHAATGWSAGHTLFNLFGATAALVVPLLVTGLGTLKRSSLALGFGLIASMVGLGGSLLCLTGSPLLGVAEALGLHAEPAARFATFGMLGVLFAVVAAAHVVAVVSQWSNRDPRPRAEAGG